MGIGINCSRLLDWHHDGNACAYNAGGGLRGLTVLSRALLTQSAYALQFFKPRPRGASRHVWKRKYLFDAQNNTPMSWRTMATEISD